LKNVLFPILHGLGADGKSMGRLVMAGY